MTETVVELQPELRPELKEPMGRVYEDADDLLAAGDGSVVAVGDVVTYHLLDAGHTPAVALVDGRTERTAVDEKIRKRIGGFDREVQVDNPPATLTAALLEELGTAIERAASETSLLVVDGEEDLATLPAILLGPDGTRVVYGQPGEGMVLVTVDGEATDRARDLLVRMDGETRRLWAVLDTE